jgi:hypothetical protein
MTKKFLKLIKALAATNTQVREQALTDAQSWAEHTDFSGYDKKQLEVDLTRLWQGLFYSMLY